ncbi:chaplin family protein [Planobispora takensis]|uniref:Chaplin domain-containing protein n=1 Tax=Planobispora takensis TaxID=1367882 RepID=A0A8J3SQ22_9ACTN|nr:chaplin family protein [Planobispora takensis]GIH98212.1 hypothetical protein Pta02_02210 [Planobispora takensis]
MRTRVKSTGSAALLALGVLVLGGGTAVADTDGDHSAGGGNQLDLPISLPVDISGNGLAVFGQADAGSKGGASAESGGGGMGGRTSGANSVLGGNQADAPVSIPVNVCGNAVALFGSSDAGCKGGASTKGGGSGGGGGRTSGESSVGGGNQVEAPIKAPVNVCGNAVSLFGSSDAGCKGGASTKGGGKSGGGRTSGESSVGGGNQVNAPVNAPVDVCGNSVSVFGEAFSGCKGGSESGSGGYNHGSHNGWHGKGNTTDGRYGAASGNQLTAPVSAPIVACGNAVAALGDAAAGCLGGSHPGGSHPGHGYGGDWGAKSGKHHTSGLMPALPVVPALGGAANTGVLPQRANGPALPVVGGVQDLAPMAELPVAPGQARDDHGAASLSADGVLPLDDLGLMSAEQPASLAGMNSGSLLALVLGGLASASAATFAMARRLRLRLSRS